MAAQNALQARIEQLDSELQDIRHRFANRESREEDLARIRQLEAEGLEWANKVKRVEEEMKFYKVCVCVYVYVRQLEAVCVCVCMCACLFVCIYACIRQLEAESLEWANKVK